MIARIQKSPNASAALKTGARNDDSSLFSLDRIRQAEESATRASRERDDSGLIDLHALAALSGAEPAQVTTSPLVVSSTAGLFGAPAVPVGAPVAPAPAAAEEANPFARSSKSKTPILVIGESWLSALPRRPSSGWRGQAPRRPRPTRPRPWRRRSPQLRPCLRRSPPPRRRPSRRSSRRRRGSARPRPRPQARCAGRRRQGCSRQGRGGSQGGGARACAQGGGKARGSRL